MTKAKLIQMQFLTKIQMPIGLNLEKVVQQKIVAVRVQMMIQAAQVAALIAEAATAVVKIPMLIAVDILMKKIMAKKETLLEIRTLYLCSRTRRTLMSKRHCSCR